MFIYCIENTINGKKYVGQTIETLDKRFKKHKSHANRGANTLLHKALRKYSPETFTISLLETCNSLEEMNLKEIEWISKLNTTNKNIGYNLTIGGRGSANGHIVTEKTKKNISKGMKNFYSNLENRKKTSILVKEGMQKWKESLSLDEYNQWKEKIKTGPNKRVNFKHTEETKLKISQSKLGKKRGKQTSEHIQKRVNAIKGRKYGPLSDTRKENISKALKERHQKKIAGLV